MVLLQGSCLLCHTRGSLLVSGAQVTKAQPEPRPSVQIKPLQCPKSTPWGRKLVVGSCQISEGADRCGNAGKCLLLSVHEEGKGQPGRFFSLQLIPQLGVSRKIINISSPSPSCALLQVRPGFSPKQSTEYVWTLVERTDNYFAVLL